MPGATYIGPPFTVGSDRRAIIAKAHQRRPRPRRLIPSRRWPRRTLIAANLIVAMVIVGTGFTYGYARYRLDSISTGSSIGLSPTDGASNHDGNVGTSTGRGTGSTRVSAKQGRKPTDSADGLEPENILLIGNETRAGQTMVNFGNASELTGTLSDVIMILHLDPKTDRASILSLPRDVFVSMPAGSEVGNYQKIDAALNDGKLGPNNLAEAITQDFGIPINHYVEVDFDGFLQTVNALGGIKVDFPERLFDVYSGLDISKTGCQLIHGQQALALVRSRHLQYDPPGVSPDDTADWPYDPESDLSRIVRDHTFVRILASTAESEGLTDPLKANSFLSAVLHQLTVDPGLKNQLISLILHYHKLNPFSAAETTIPVTQVGGADGTGYIYDGYNVGDVEFADEPADTRTIEKWDPGALPKPVRPKSVDIYDIAGTDQLSASLGSALRADGFNVALETSGTVPGYESETFVQYHPGQLADGFAVFEKLSGAAVLQSLASVPAGTVEVQAGSSVAVDTPATSTAHHPTSRTTTTTPSTTVPTPGGQAPSSSNDQTTPYDPKPC
jgi:LCP family protein required for cell wall assembly